MNRSFRILALAALLACGGLWLSWPVPVPAAQEAVAASETGAPPRTGARAVHETEHWRETVLMIAGAVLAVALLAIPIVLWRRLRGARRPAETAEPRAFLCDRSGITRQTTHRLGSRPILIGRAADIVANGYDHIIVPDQTIGRCHAMIEYKHAGFWIVDQGSSNGTYVNEFRVTTEMRLKDGDCIRLHKFAFDFVEPQDGGHGAGHA